MEIVNWINKPFVANNSPIGRQFQLVAGSKFANNFQNFGFFSHYESLKMCKTVKNGRKIETTPETWIQPIQVSKFSYMPDWA